LSDHDDRPELQTNLIDKPNHSAETNMKKILIASLVICASGALLAQAKPDAKAEPKVKPGASRTELNTKAKNMAAGVTAAEAALTPAQLTVADSVYIGRLPCELGAYVTIAKDAKNPGYFELQTGAHKFHMFPVVTSTGAIRLEDPKAGGVWLQLANKSMLMSQKLGSRLADECMSPAQVVVAQNLKANPAPNLLEPLPAAGAKTATK
jgi:hypothetical protein